MERKEPTFSSSSPNPEKDNGSARPQRPGQEQAAARRPVRTPVASAPVQEAASGSPLVIIALLLAIAALGGSGFLAWQLNEAQVSLGAASDRIRDLEQRLDLTSDESSETVSEFRDKLQWADTEIRKLWGVSYDTNRKAIAANKEQVERVSRDLAVVRKDAADAKSQSAALQQQVAASKAAVDKALAEINTKLNGVEDQRSRLQAMSERLSRAESQLQDMRTLNSRVQSNEEAIAAIDAYRRTVNRDLLQIKQHLGMPAN
jgi:flagellin-like hook-associated protein FlgL